MRPQTQSLPNFSLPRHFQDLAAFALAGRGPSGAKSPWGIGRKRPAILTAMERSKRRSPNSVLEFARRTMRDIYLPRITRCLAALSQDDIWWRPAAASNSAGNLVLHLQGNVRQWIISGLGGAKDVRQRNREFSDAGPIPRRTLIEELRTTVREACAVLSGLSAYSIQGFSITGFHAVLHVTEHFSHHAGQIIYITKLRTEKDLRFTRLPGDRRAKRKPKLRVV
jgi:hypothetical protein